MLDNIVRDWTVMIDGVLLRGDIDTCDLPKISRKVDEYRGAAMDRPIEIEMGYEKMDFTFEMTKIDPVLHSLIGLSGSAPRTLVVYGYTVSYDGTESGFKDTMHGIIKDQDAIALKPGDKTKIKFTSTVNDYKREIGGSEVFFSDPLNLILRVNGVDQYAKRRQILGIG